MLYNLLSAIFSKFTINSYKLTEIHINLEKIKTCWWKGAERPDFNNVYCYHRRKGAKWPDFNTIYCYYKHCATLPQNVDGRKQSNLTSRLYTITTKFCWKGAKQPDFNTVYCYYRRKRAKQPDFNTIYCYHRKTGAKQPDFNTIYYYYKHYTILPQKVDGREQSDLTSILYTATVSDQPRAAVVPVRRDLERGEGEGAPLVDQDD